LLAVWSQKLLNCRKVFKTGKIVPVGFQNWQEWPCPVFKGGWGSAAGFSKENCLSETYLVDFKKSRDWP
jgi:hypothetical protein